MRQGRTDAWVAHQLEVTVQQIQAFKRENELAPGEEAEASAAGVDFDDEIDLRAEDDALIAAELEAEQARAAEAAEAAGDEEPGDDAEAEAASEEGAAPRRRGRARRGRGRRTTKGPAVLEGTFDHGEEGYGLWLDPAVEDNAVYAEHWAGHRPVEVTIEADRIVIRRSGADGAEDDE